MKPIAQWLSLSSLFVALTGCAGAATVSEEPATAATSAASIPTSSDENTTPSRAALDEPDYIADETRSASAVFDGMSGDLRACYVRRLATNPKAQAFMTFDVVIDSSGHVQSVETTGGAQLGDATIKCLVDRVGGATFTPPHGGGTLRIQVPLELTPNG